MDDLKTLTDPEALAESAEENFGSGTDLSMAKARLGELEKRFGDHAKQIDWLTIFQKTVLFVMFVTILSMIGSWYGILAEKFDLQSQAYREYASTLRDLKDENTKLELKNFLLEELVKKSEVAIPIAPTEKP